MRRSAKRCAACNQALRKGSSVMITMWSKLGNINADGYTLVGTSLVLMEHTRCVEARDKAKAAAGDPQ